MKGPGKPSPRSLCAHRSGEGELLGVDFAGGEEMSVFTGCPPFFLCQLQAKVKEMMRSFVDSESDLG